MTWRSLIAALGTAAELARSGRGLYEIVNQTRDENRAPSQKEPVIGTESAAGLHELRLRIEKLEANGTEQAELVSRMADQNQALADGLRLMASRVDKVFWVSVVALVVSSALLLTELIRFLR